ncbi:MAG: sugar phosphate isomerase/epimerase family protein [Armatimonadota bacterium]
MSFRYAAYTVMTPELTIEQTASMLEELGYNGVEWRVHSVPKLNSDKTDFFLANKATIDLNEIKDKARYVKELSQSHNLEILCLGTYLNYKMTDEIEECMLAANIMGAPNIRVATPGYDGTVNYNDLVVDAISGFIKVAELAEKYKVRAVVELHRNNICYNASTAYRFMSSFDPDQVGVIMDPANLMAGGSFNWQMGFEILGPYLAYLHVKNNKWVVDSVSDDGEVSYKISRASLKEGIVSWRDVLIALNNVGYNGWLSLEDFSEGDTKTKLKDNLAYLKSIEHALGIDFDIL